MKKVIFLFAIIVIVILLIWPSLSLAIEFTSQEISAIVKISSYLPKGAIDQQIRSLRGFYSDEELAEYRKQLEKQTQKGSGLMVTYMGCVLTNKHVIYDEQSGGTNNNIHLYSTGNLLSLEEDLGEAEVIWRSTMLDLAIVCLKNSQGKFYPHFTLKKEDYQDFKLTLGESIYNLGYPLSNENNSLTLTSGVISGIWDKDYLKGDIIIAGGASGSPIFNSQKQVIGLASGNGGEGGLFGIFLKPSYVYGWYDLYSQTFRELIAESAGCTNATQYHIYKKQDQEYYDLSCQIKRNLGLEAKLAYEYQKYCGKDSNIDNIVEVASYIASKKSTLDHWLGYLEETCLKPESLVTVFEATKE
jgi:V8-like Glu-specific endopeptidase